MELARRDRHSGAHGAVGTATDGRRYDSNAQAHRRAWNAAHARQPGWPGRPDLALGQRRRTQAAARRPDAAGQPGAALPLRNRRRRARRTGDAAAQRDHLHAASAGARHPPHRNRAQPQVWQPDKGDGVEFVIQIDTTTGRHELLRRYIDPKRQPTDRRWHNIAIDLSAFAGQDVRLTLHTLPGPSGDGRYDWAGWGAPMIIQQQ